MTTKMNVKNVIGNEEYIKIGKKTMICCLTLDNGFEVIGTSASVDPRKFNESKGKKISREVAINKIEELEGYRVQTELMFYQK